MRAVGEIAQHPDSHKIIFLLYLWLANSTIIQHVAILVVFTKKYVEWPWQRCSWLDQHTIVLAHLWSQANEIFNLNLIPCFCIVYESDFLHPAECVFFFIRYATYLLSVCETAPGLQWRGGGGGKGRECIRFWDVSVKGGVSSLRGQHAVVYPLLSSELKYYLCLRQETGSIKRRRKGGWG